MSLIRKLAVTDGDVARTRTQIDLETRASRECITRLLVFDAIRSSPAPTLVLVTRTLVLVTRTLTLVITGSLARWYC